MKKFIVALSAFCVAVFAYSETIVAVTNTPGFVQLDSYNDTKKLVAGTIHQTEYPTSLVGNPQFWFDCSQTNGWTVAANGKVSLIPSLVGERTLTTVKGSGTQTFNNWWVQNNPVFTNDTALGGMPVLDFGIKGSSRGLVFNAIEATGNTNRLDGIGSIIAVWYSARGTGVYGEGGYYGGQFVGGGYSFAGGTDGIMWGRDVTTQARQVNVESGSYRPRWFDNAFFQASHTHLANQNAVVRHDGMPTIGTKVGMAGSWEVASTIPNADGTVRAFPPATGIGMNDARVIEVSGGFKVAEMLIFDKALTSEECEKVEAYLNWKWFAKRAAPGVNGEAKIGWIRPVRYVAGAATAVDQQVEVNAGDKLVISRVGGGRGVGEPGIFKTGEGQLQIDDARNFNGAIKMNGGTLTFSGKAIPAGLPRNPYIHFDASDSNSVVSSGGDLSVWRNLAADGAWKEKAICARPYDSLNAPKILADALGADLDVIDFGDLTQNSGSCYLKLVTNETGEITAATTAAPPGVATVLAVVGAQRGGGALFGATGSGNNYVTRYSSVAYCYQTTLFGTYSAGFSQSQAKNQAWIDGIPADGVNQGYLTPGYQVVAIKMPGNPAIDKIGASGALFGGLRIGEIVMYRYVLTDEQILDATAYLMKKWLNREAPGYAKFNGRKTADLQKVTAISDTRIDVPNGVTARVGNLSSAGGKLIKTGGGTLEYQKMNAETVTVEDGMLVQVTKPDVSTAFKTDDNSWLAEDPALHLDVSNALSMEIEEVNDERRVVAWYSDDKGVLAMPPYFRGTTSYGSMNYVPYLSSTVQLNGHDTLDFGPYSSAKGGRSLALSRSFDSVRSAFLVWCPRDDTRGSYFGNTGSTSSLKHNTNGEFYDFLRDETATNNCPLLNSNATANHVSQGEIYTNGIAVTRAAVMQPGVFTLTEFHPVAGAHISALGTDREVERLTGGIRMAEVVLYERVLSDREKVATRNYLMQKWFNATPAALPAAPKETAELVEIAVDGEMGMNVEIGAAAIKITGDGDFEKTGQGVLQIRDLSGFNGTVTVAEGTLHLTGNRPASSGELIADGLIYQADAGWGISSVTNADGSVSVTNWASKAGNGWTAVPLVTNKYAKLITAKDLNGSKVVDMPFGSEAAFRFKKNGEYAILDNIGSIFWVVGSHEGGGYLMGGGTNYSSSAGSGARYNFMRDRDGHTSAYFKASDHILNGVEYWTVPENLRSAAWYKDGASVNPTTASLSGAWDLLSMCIIDTSHPITCADGFAFDGRYLADGSMGGTWIGQQRLAEVLVYDHKLGDDDRQKVEAYLRTKWGYGGSQASSTNAAAVSVAAGATLDLGGTNQYVAAISGAGTVTNGTLAIGTLVADPTLAALPEFKDVTVAIEAGQKVTVANAGTITQDTVITILACESIAGLENLETAIIAGVPDDRFTVKLVFENGVLGVKFLPRGLIFQIR